MRDWIIVTFGVGIFFMSLPLWIPPLSSQVSWITTTPPRLCKGMTSMKLPIIGWTSPVCGRWEHCRPVGPRDQWVAIGEDGIQCNARPSEGGEE